MNTIRTIDVVIFIIVLSLLLRRSPSAGLETTLRRLERKVDRILTHLGLDFHEGLDAKLLELRNAGQKIEAIKLYREQSGVGLKEAKDYVEAL